MKKITKLLICSVMCFSMVLTSAGFASAEVKELQVDYHTKQEIYNYVKEKNIDLDFDTQYSEQPSTTQPYAPGNLTDETLNSALNTLNTMRYIAGLSEVTLSDEYNECSQAGALISAINGGLSHYPTQPDGMSDELYEKAYKGCNKGNIGYSTGYDLNRSIVEGWMADTGKNISTLGHRRWILNPDMKSTGFGQVGIYQTMYAHDGYDPNAFDRVAWPAQVTPVEYFKSDYPWSLTIGYPIYNPENVTVKVVRESDSREWTLTTSTSTDGVMYINNDAYGQEGCIIFKPSGITCYDGNVYDVTVTGNFGTVAYDVEFFSLDNVVSSSTVTFDADNGTENIVKTVNADEKLDYTPETPTKAGYTFVGWYRDTDDTTTGYKTGVTYNQDTTYKAKWAHVDML